jgi:polyphosphate kinase 2
MKRKKYEEALDPMRSELENLARWLQHTGKRMLVIFEGRDTAGKGGVINAITERLNPRQVKVAALSKPSEAERTQWYYQRYIAHLPSAGELVLFDRSWYNRAGVEKVMGFCTKDEYEQFLEQTPVFERMLVDSGIILLKYWLAVDQKEQEERFAERAQNEEKRWKLSPIDLKARDYYEEYGRARDKMFEATHTKHAPWFIVEFDDQKRGRLNLIRHLLDQVPDKKVPVEPLVLSRLKEKLQKEKYRGPVSPIKNKY